MMQLVALVTVDLHPTAACTPIIGPPMMWPLVSGFAPASATSSSTGVPISTSKFCACCTLPVTVTMREISGSPCVDGAMRAVGGGNIEALHAQIGGAHTRRNLDAGQHAYQLLGAAAGINGGHRDHFHIAE